VKMVSNDGHKYYQDERGRVYRTLEEMHHKMQHEMKKRNYYSDDDKFSF